jgi:hypothetical protein
MIPEALQLIRPMPSTKPSDIRSPKHKEPLATVPARSGAVAVTLPVIFVKYSISPFGELSDCWTSVKLAPSAPVKPAIPSV